MQKKKIDLGEYVIKIEYDKDTGYLSVNILDELGDLIENVEITTDEDDEEDDNTFNPSLN